jgi:hypothetical protein
MNNDLRKAVVQLGYDAMILRSEIRRATSCNTEDAVNAAFILSEAAAAICEAITKIAAPQSTAVSGLDNVVPFRAPSK